jgi:hypothetical protein
MSRSVMSVSQCLGSRGKSEHRSVPVTLSQVTMLFSSPVSTMIFHLPVLSITERFISIFDCNWVCVFLLTVIPVFL